MYDLGFSFLFYIFTLGARLIDLVWALVFSVTIWRRCFLFHFPPSCRIWEFSCYLLLFFFRPGYVSRQLILATFFCSSFLPLFFLCIYLPYQHSSRFDIIYRAILLLFYMIIAHLLHYLPRSLTRSCLPA